MDERDYVYSYCLVQIIKDNPKGKNGETVLKTDGWILRTKEGTTEGGKRYSRLKRLLDGVLKQYSAFPFILLLAALSIDSIHLFDDKWRSLELKEGYSVSTNSHLELSQRRLLERYLLFGFWSREKSRGGE